MIDLLLAIGWSNLLVSAGLAGIAAIAQRAGARPPIVHALWLVVLLKLVTPPMWGVSSAALPWTNAATAELHAEVEEAIALTQAENRASSATLAVDTGDLDLLSVADTTPGLKLKSALVYGWALGSLLVLVWSVAQMLRFHCRLGRATVDAPKEIFREVRRSANRLGLRHLPQVRLTSARLSPMVWAVGRRPQLILPEHLLQELDPIQMRMVLAHELAHLRRRDHLVRWVEWLACIAFWWNPVSWWARRALRAHEEICCDALVMTALRADRRDYAGSLLAAIEFLAAPKLRAPALASALSDGGTLERRFQMILSKKSIPSLPRRAQVLLLTGALALLPLGIAGAQEPDYGSVGKRLRAAVEAGEITAPQARTMLGALRGTQPKAERAVDPRAVEAPVRWRIAADRRSVELVPGQSLVATDQVQLRLVDDQQQAETDLTAARNRGHQARIEEVYRAVASGRITREMADTRTAARRDVLLTAQIAVDAEDEIGWVTPKQTDATKARVKQQLAASERDSVVRWVAEENKDGYAVRRGGLVAVDTVVVREIPKQDQLKRFVAAQQKLEAQVAAGKVKQDQADQRLARYAQSLWGGEQAKQEDTDADAKRNRAYAEYAKGVKARVNAGVLTAEEANRLLAGKKEQLWAAPKRRAGDRR